MRSSAMSAKSNLRDVRALENGNVPTQPQPLNTTCGAQNDARQQPRKDSIVRDTLLPHR